MCFSVFFSVYNDLKYLTIALDEWIFIYYHKIMSSSIAILSSIKDKERRLKDLKEKGSLDQAGDLLARYRVDFCCCKVVNFVRMKSEERISNYYFGISSG